MLDNVNFFSMIGSETDPKKLEYNPYLVPSDTSFFYFYILNKY